MDLTCTVIIPVGRGHQELAQQALQSVIAASQDPGPFETINVVLGDDPENKRGRSAVRNACVRGAPHENGDGRSEIIAEPWMMVFSSGDSLSQAFMSDWLFFLDADDMLCSAATYGMSAFKVVERYVEDYDCIWGTIHELHKNGDVLKRRQTDRITTYKAFIKTPPTLACQMGHFVRREKFLGFDESLDVCEDVDLYVREWKSLRCIKQEKPLFLNRRGFHTWMQPSEDGRMTHTGREWSVRAEEMMKAAREELEQ